MNKRPLRFERVSTEVQEMINLIIHLSHNVPTKDGAIPELYEKIAKEIYERAQTPIELKNVEFENDPLSGWAQNIAGTGLTLQFYVDEKSGNAYGLCYAPIAVPKRLIEALAFAVLFSSKKIPDWEIYRRHFSTGNKEWNDVVIRFPLSIEKPPIPEKLQEELDLAQLAQDERKENAIWKEMYAFYAAWRENLAAATKTLFGNHKLGILFDEE